MRWMLAALLVAALISAPAPAGAATSESPPLSCDQRLALDGYRPAVTPEVIFIGVRGSGESPKLVEGLGRRSVLLYRALVGSPEYRDRIVCTSALLGSYQAQSMPNLSASAQQWRVFVQEMMGSADALATPLEKMAQKFPSATFIIAGFSKGAAVAQLGVEQAIQDNPALAKRIESVVLISSPLTPNGIVPITQRLASTPLRSLAIKTTIRLLSNIHKVIPDRCLLPGCSSLKRVSKVFAQRQAALLNSFNAVTSSETVTVSQLAQRVPVISVCKAGDVICAPLSAKSVPSLSIHNNWYQNHQDWTSLSLRQLTQRKTK